MNAPAEQSKIRITSPEKVVRLIELVGQSGLPLIIRSVVAPAVAVKARALAASPGEKVSCIKISNVSDRGMQYLMQNGSNPFSIEFILKSEKVQFQSSLEMVNRQVCFFSLPNFIESLERRKNARYMVSENLRAFLSFQNMQADALDHAAQPIFESAREMASFVPVSDISLGGIGLQFRFPAIQRVIDAARPSESASLWLPMSGPTSVDVSIRWSRRVIDQITDEYGVVRGIKSIRLGIQFLNLSEHQLRGIQIFLQRLSQADAI